MIRRICRECGLEMIKELTPDGPKFSCEQCGDNALFDEYEMEPYCPVCNDKLQFCAKCSQGFFCKTCNGLVSRKKIVWKEK